MKRATAIVSCLLMTWISLAQLKLDWTRFTGKLYALAVDSQGNVFASTGPIGGGGPGYLTKYSPSGKPLWQRTFPSSYSVDLVVDSHDNVFYNADHTYKLDRDGRQVFVADGHTGPFSVDRDGNLYLATWVDVSQRNSDLYVRKLDPAGNEIWHWQYDGSHHVNDSARDIKVDSAHNVYLSATLDASEGHSGDMFAGIKLLPNGQPEWIVNFGSSFCYAIAVQLDNRELPIFLGQGRFNGEVGRGIAAYSAGGGVRWTYLLPFGANYDWNLGFQLDAAANVYVSGTRSDGDNPFAHVAKLSTDGGVLWEIVLAAPLEAEALQLDALGNALLLGLNGHTTDIAKIDPAGNVLWRVNSSRFAPNWSGANLLLHPNGSLIFGGTSYLASLNHWELSSYRQL